jgi:hypothetical protein
MSASQSSQWFWSDWAGDRAVRRLTPAERGLWIDLLSYAAVGSPTGYVCDDRGNPVSYEEIARFTNATLTEVESLIAGILEKGAASRDRTGRLFNRRMVRQAERSAKKRMAGRLGGEHTRLKWLELNGVPQHLPQRMPQHRETTPSNPSLKPSSTVSVERAEARQGSVASPELLAALARKQSA